MDESEIEFSELPEKITETNNIEILFPLVNTENFIDERNSTNLSISVENVISCNETTFTYVENELYHFLNDRNNFFGNVILAEYFKSKELDHSKLKELIIIEELKRDPIHYKITSSRFMEISELIIQLFPTEDKEIFFVPHCSDGKDSRTAHGCLYNYYKSIRIRLRSSGLLKASESKEENNNESNQGGECNLSCLMDENREEYQLVDVLKEWQRTFSERSKLLLTNKKKKFIETYFKSFNCLKSPIGIILFESHFSNVMEELHNKEQISNNAPVNYKTKLSSSWIADSKIVIQFCKKSKIREVKQFYAKYQNLLTEDTHNSLLALLLHPLYFTVPKSVKTDGKRSVTFSKEEILRSFILHVEDPSNLEADKESREEWLKINSQEIFPYTILCGKIENISQSIVVLNGESYLFSSPIKAIEACFKCLIALRTFPYLTDHLWFFIAKFVYRIDSFKSYAAVLKLIVELNKIKDANNPASSEIEVPMEVDLL